MKNINLPLLILTFSSLLVGCGMKGPLYQEAPKKTIEEETPKQQDNVVEVETETTETLTTLE